MNPCVGQSGTGLSLLRQAAFRPPRVPDRICTIAGKCFRPFYTTEMCFWERTTVGRLFRSGGSSRSPHCGVLQWSLPCDLSLNVGFRQTVLANVARAVLITE